MQISFSTKPRVVNAINVRAFKFVLIPFVLGQSCATSLLMLRAVGFVTKYFNAALISTRVGFIVLMTIVLHVFDMSGKMRFLFKLFVANQAFEHILFDNNNGVFRRQHKITFLASGSSRLVVKIHYIPTIFERAAIRNFDSLNSRIFLESFLYIFLCFRIHRFNL